MKNVVFILDIKLDNTKILQHEFSIKSWKSWCEKNNYELFVLNDLLFPIEKMGISWQKYYLFDIFNQNNVDFNQVLMISANTIIHPNCPNFFDMTENKLCSVRAESSFDFILRSIENYSKYIFDGYKMKWWNYIDSEFLLFNKSHESFLKKIVKFYWTNKEKLLDTEKLNCGTDQTPLNFIIDKENIDIKFFTYQYNMIDMIRKEILREDMIFTKCGWIYNFNSIPSDQAKYYWMEQTYKYLYCM